MAARQSRPKNRRIKEPRNKKKISGTFRNSRRAASVAAMTPSPSPLFPNLVSKIPTLPCWVWPLIIIGGLLLALGYWQKDWVVAATVNGKPVLGTELLGRIGRDYRTVALENLVNEKVIMQEAQKRGAVPSDLEIEARVGELEAKYRGKEFFEQLLEQQGQTRDSVKSQIAIQLAMEKMFGNEATVSAEEVTNYVAENREFLQATDSAGQKQEAEQTLRDQKLREIFAAKFNELKNSASIKIY